MQHGHVVPELELASLAKQARLQAGVTQVEAAQQLDVTQASISHAENSPERYLTSLRLAMISKFSGDYEAVGPFYVVKQKDDKLAGMYF